MAARMLRPPSRPRRNVSCPSRTARWSCSKSSIRPSAKTSATTIRSELAPTSMAATVVAVAAPAELVSLESMVSGILRPTLAR